MKPATLKLLREQMREIRGKLDRLEDLLIQEAAMPEKSQWWHIWPHYAPVYKEPGGPKPPYIARDPVQPGSGGITTDNTLSRGDSVPPMPDSVQQRPDSVPSMPDSVLPKPDDYPPNKA